jgi:hypothetical protein
MWWHLPLKKKITCNKRELAIGYFVFKKLCHTISKNTIGQRIYCIAFAQLYSWKLFEFEFSNEMGQWNVVITNKRKSCVQFITFQNPAHTALTLPWKCNPKFPCSSPIGHCHDVNEDWFWHQVFQFSTSTQSNLQEFRTTTPLAIANNITIGCSKKYPSGFLQLAMGKIQTLWQPIIDIHQETWWN